ATASAIGQSVRVAGLNERVAESLRRSPYLWLAMTILAMLLLNSGLARIAASPGEGSTALALAGSGGVVWGTAGWVVFQTSRVRRGMSASNLIVVRWILAVTPFLFAYGAVSAGGEQWAFTLGFVASVILLAVSARRTKR